MKRYTHVNLAGRGNGLNDMSTCYKIEKLKNDNFGNLQAGMDPGWMGGPRNAQCCTNEGY